MDDLIKALQIMRKYGNPKWPTNCEHDVMFVNIDSDLVSDEDKEQLDLLGFFVGSEGGFESFTFGSC